MTDHKSLGNRLIEKGILKEDQLNKALAEQSISGKKLGDILVDLGFVSEEDVVAILSDQMGLAYIDLSSYQVESEVIALVDEKVAHQFQMIPLFKIDNVLTVAMADPLNIQAVDELNRITKLEIQPVFSTKGAIRESLNKYYKKGSDLDAAISAFQEKASQEKSQGGVTPIVDISFSAETGGEDAPAIKLVNLILAQSVQDGASDIHFEPGDNVFNIRCRIDGALTSLTPPPFSLRASITSRLKVLANLDIAEKRLPQDGRVQIIVGSKTVDLRVSSFPTIYGENIVIRILDKSSGILTLEKLGLTPERLQALRDLITIPTGIILVTGPTGSGKTTTLYAFLNELNREDKNIMTLEDPVEYRIAGIRQANVDVKANLTFQVGLRSVMRQDPDIIMIGEIRDRETAEISIQAALTGHLVLSTLHTNDSPSAVARLIDMGIEPFLVSSSLEGVIAQRLVRKLCDHCKKPYTPSAALLARIGLPEKAYTFYEEAGCEKCRNTGFKGRIGIYEVFVPTPEIKHMINEKKSSGEIAEYARLKGFKELKWDGIDKIINGITSVTEVLRAT
jgi:type IV pilus assembly protein PilB